MKRKFGDLALEGRKKGQNLTEIAIFLAVIGASLTAMALYMQRNLQERYRQGAAHVFTVLRAHVNNPAEVTPQYAPYYHSSYRQESKVSSETMGFPRHTRNATVNESGWERVSIN
ncbi:MAG: hypothetical protein NC923_04525 [Candidatus Omnitrophica bacterium]|nr:hypothetical protein [Candidatus Omnitrophota bacterium]